MMEILFGAAILVAVALYAYFNARGEKVGEVRGNYENLDQLMFSRMRVVVVRRTGRDAETPRIDLHLGVAGIARVLAFDAGQAEALAVLLEDAATRAKA